MFIIKVKGVDAYIDRYGQLVHDINLSQLYNSVKGARMSLASQVAGIKSRTNYELTDYEIREVEVNIKLK